MGDIRVDDAVKAQPDSGLGMLPFFGPADRSDVEWMDAVVTEYHADDDTFDVKFKHDNAVRQRVPRKELQLLQRRASMVYAAGRSTDGYLRVLAGADRRLWVGARRDRGGAQDPAARACATRSQTRRRASSAASKTTRQKLV